MINTDSKPPESLKILLSIKEAADSLGISERQLRYMKNKREVAHVRIGRRLLFPVADLERWINEHKEGGEV